MSTLKEIKLYKSPKRVIKLLIVSTLFLALGYYLINYSNTPIVGWINVLFFSLGYPVAFYHLFDKRPQILINEIGIYDRTTHSDIINWEIIRGAYLKTVKGQTFICLDTDDSFVPKLKNKRNLSVLLGFGKLNLSLGQINVDPDKLLSILNKMIHADRNGRKIIMLESPKLEAD